MSDSEVLLLGASGGAAGRVPRLTRRRTNFLDADTGQIVKYRGGTGFTIVQDFLRGTDRTVYIRWLRAKGCTHIRAFGMWGKNDPIGIFDPRDYGDAFYARLVECARWLGSEGMGLHYVCATDQVPGSGVAFTGGVLFPHHARCLEALAPVPGVLFEDLNEFEFNGKVVFPAATPDGLLRTRSSWVDGATPPSVGVPLLHFTTEHDPRGAEWERKAKNLLETCRLGREPEGQPAFPPTNNPAIGGEPERMQNATPRQYADYTAVGELYGAGTCLHGDAATLQQCQIPPDESVPNAVAAVRADPPPADLVEIGEYSRGQADGQGTCPLVHSDATALRRFAMIHPDQRHATAVVVSPRTSAPEQPRNGWHIVRQYGYAGNTIDLER